MSVTPASSDTQGTPARPRLLEGRLGGFVELLKPVTWFPPMFAYGCGVASIGISDSRQWLELVAGMLLAGPLVCGASQIVNDWFDRHVDAINEPHRPIPSGRVPGRQGLCFAILWSLLSAAVAFLLGPAVFFAGLLGLALAWAYSAPPLRLKANGWFGNAAVGLCYEGLPWFTGAAALLGQAPSWQLVAVALLYSLGAHGIMTLNDFKSIEGDRRMNIRSVPVQLGPERAIRAACLFMVLPQMVVIGLLLAWNAPGYAAAVAAVLAAQMALMPRLIADPRGRAPWYNATGVTLYVSGMMISAFALRSLAAGGG